VFEDGDPVLGRGGDVDLVRADAEGADSHQIVGRLQDPRGHVRLGPDPEERDTRQGGDQLVLVVGPTDRGDLESGALQDLHRFGVDLFEEQYAGHAHRPVSFAGSGNSPHILGGAIRCTGRLVDHTRLTPTPPRVSAP
jgi:hypothetical protein